LFIIYTIRGWPLMMINRWVLFLKSRLVNSDQTVANSALHHQAACVQTGRAVGTRERGMGGGGQPPNIRAYSIWSSSGWWIMWFISIWEKSNSFPPLDFQTFLRPWQGELYLLNERTLFSVRFMKKIPSFSLCLTMTRFL
jgi:hypothetical protein